MHARTRGGGLLCFAGQMAAMAENATEPQWPEAWYMCEEVEDQKAENRREPNAPATVEMLKDLGICYWKLDAGKYEYPVKSVPWDPSDAVDPVRAPCRPGPEPPFPACPLLLL